MLIICLKCSRRMFRITNILNTSTQAIVRWIYAFAAICNYSRICAEQGCSLYNQNYTIHIHYHSVFKIPPNYCIFVLYFIIDLIVSLKSENETERIKKNFDIVCSQDTIKHDTWQSSSSSSQSPELKIIKSLITKD